MKEGIPLADQFRKVVFSGLPKPFMMCSSERSTLQYAGEYGRWKKEQRHKRIKRDSKDQRDRGDRKNRKGKSERRERGENRKTGVTRKIRGKGETGKTLTLTLFIFHLASSDIKNF